MHRIALALAVAASTALIVPTAASAVVPADARYAGGEVADKPTGRAFFGRAGDVSVTARTIGTARVQAGATVLHACGRVVGQAIGTGRAPVAPDGSFTVNSRDVVRDGRQRTTFRVTIQGRIDGARLTGTVTSSTTERRGGRSRRVCRGSAPFTSITLPIAGTQQAAAPAGAVLRGGLDAMSFSPYELVLRVAADGTSIVRVITSLPWRCNGRRGAQVFYERGGPIAADGTFRLSAPYAFRETRGAVERGRVTIAGRFTDTGATGTVTASSRTRRGSRTIETCRSGTRNWTAAP